MIKPEELRLGVTVAAEVSNGTETVRVTGKVTGILKDAVYLGDGIKFSIDDLHPIPLTTEILDSCNLPFEKVDREDSRPRAWLVKDDLYIGRLTEHEYYVGIAYTDRFESWELAVVGQPLKYLHQAQNAIFALTGQELTVQLNQPA